MWVEALYEFFKILTQKEYEDIHTIKISYNSIRPKGERLKTFGGTASGHEPLKEMFEGIDKVLKNQLDPSLDPIVTDEKGYGQVRPIHILDIGNLIGANVVVGGVRRTAQIFLFDEDDYEVMFAKYGINGIWDEEKHKEVIEKTRKLGLDKIANWLENLKLYDANVRPLHHRRMSNNSVWFEHKPIKEKLDLIFTLLKTEGEPGFGNAEAAKRRRPNAEGVNPCFEILLDSYGVCNLTTVNVDAFVYKDENGQYKLDLDGLLEAQKLSARVGLRMTLATLELPHWDKVQKRDRLIGTSLTGWKDAIDKLNYTEEQEIELMKLLKKTAKESAESYAKELRIASPLLATTIKPEGTLSQVAGGVSSGLHWSHSPYYIRRIRITATDPLVKVAKELGWTIHAEVGTLNYTKEEDLAKPEAIEAARTLVIDFPIATGSKRTKDDISVKEQFDTYFRFQRNYTEHNSSNTITVKPHEWEEAKEIIWENWNDFVGVSFLPYDGGTYTLAPYEAITKEQYEELKSKMKPFDPKLLRKYEHSETEADLENMEECSSGVCPIR